MPETAKLEALSTGQPVEITQMQGGYVTVGREPENTVIVDSDSLSRTHAAFVGAGTQWVFTDLDSTNGSWVNDIPVKGGQIRLLRDGDVVQLAEVLLRFSEMSGGDGLGIGNNPGQSLLVFAGDDFQAEIPLISEGSRFTVGGPEADLVLEGDQSDRAHVVIGHVGGKVEMSVGMGSIPVIVNGLAAQGTVALVDRDDVEVAGYHLVLSNPELRRVVRSNDRPGAATMGLSGDPTAGSAAAAGQHNPPMMDEDWQRETARRRGMSGRHFVFGSDVEEPSHDETIAIDRESFTSSAGLEMSPSQRFSGMYQQQDDEPQSEMQALILTGLGFLVFMIILGAVGYFLIQSM